VGSYAVNIALLTLCTIERHDMFDSLADEALAEAGRTGAALEFVLLSTFRAIELDRRGQPLDVEQLTRDALDASALNGWRHGAPSLVGLLMASLLEQGRVEEAAAVLSGYRYDCEDPADYPTAMLLQARGRLRIAAGAPREGVSDLLRCGRRMTELGVVSPSLLPWRSHAALGHLALGERDRALPLAAEELQLARRLAGPIAIGGALRVLGLATSGREGIALLREAEAELDRSPNRLEQARVRVDLGAALRRAGRSLEAREPLRNGYQLATDCHAAGLAVLAHDELLAAGARPRRTHQRGPEALTASELRVAGLAAEGLSNSAIAHNLFVSRKTVEKHLAAAYRKLGITSRGGLDLAPLAATRSRR
jgi:DNA-binding CsgD family transcriptional regulator